ncbi:MAG: hypothetical protein VXW43_03455, partial [Pseudomonadota bacterium]|nr:hypothetical protein [Pseudomonadota bacterium]
AIEAEIPQEHKDFVQSIIDRFDVPAATKPGMRTRFIRSSEIEAEQIEAERMDMAGTEWATNVEIEKLSEHYEQRLDDAGFFFPDHKAEGMKMNLRNLWSRMPLTRADVQTLHGILRQMVRWKDRSG